MPAPHEYLLAKFDLQKSRVLYPTNLRLRNRPNLKLKNLPARLIIECVAACPQPFSQLLPTARGVVEQKSFFLF